MTPVILIVLKKEKEKLILMREKVRTPYALLTLLLLRLISAEMWSLLLQPFLKYRVQR